MWVHQTITLSPKTRGYHLITEQVVNQLAGLPKINVGVLHLFIQHTSASLTLNENADPTVRQDLESHINRMVPENMDYYLHNYEGADDMPAHLKASLLGNHLTIPIVDGSLELGVWQGIILGEHRVSANGRRLIALLCGE